VILLVEDNPEDEALTVRALQQSNLANGLVIKRNGEEALEWLRTTDQLPSVILLDLKLPKVDGLDVLRELRADPRTQLLPVVVLTSSSGERARVDSYRLGANSYLRKPVDFAEFVAAVQHLGLYWMVLNETPPEER